MTFTCYGPRRGWCGIRHASHQSAQDCKANDLRLQFLAYGDLLHRLRPDIEISDRQTYGYNQIADVHAAMLAADAERKSRT